MTAVQDSLRSYQSYWERRTAFSPSFLFICMDKCYFRNQNVSTRDFSLNFVEFISSEIFQSGVCSWSLTHQEHLDIIKVMNPVGFYPEITWCTELFLWLSVFTHHVSVIVWIESIPVVIWWLCDLMNWILCCFQINQHSGFDCFDCFIVIFV